MLRLRVTLVAALVIAVFAPSASASHPRTGVLDEPLGRLIVDFFYSETDSFGFTDTWEEWTPPEGVTFAVFEFWGGAGESGEGHGHVVAGVDLEPGEAYRIRVGGGGEDTAAYSLRCAIPEWWECGSTVIAAGGDSAMSGNQTNLVPSGASPEIERWEGGGPNSEPASGWAVIHYWPDDPPIDENPPPTGDHGSIGTPVAGAEIVQLAPAPGLVSRLCKVRRKGRRAPLRIVSRRVDLDYRKVVHPRKRAACGSMRP